MNSDWDFYFLHVDDKPASIAVDLGARNVAPIRSHPFMGYIRVLMRQARPDGLSSQEEFESLSAIGDAIENDLPKDGANIFVGRNTSDGKRDYFFYVRDPSAFEQSAASEMASFPAYEFETGSREDAEWDTYLSFLYPSPVDLQRLLNRRVLDQLREHGDNHEIERNIDHDAQFSSVNAREDFVAYIVSHDFRVNELSEYATSERRFAVNFARTDPPSQIDAIVVPLHLKAVELGGEYDGWGCPVEN